VRLSGPPVGGPSVSDVKTSSSVPAVSDISAMSSHHARIWSFTGGGGHRYQARLTGTDYDTIMLCASNHGS
jgi:hypothetical protein